MNKTFRDIIIPYFIFLILYEFFISQLGFGTIMSSVPNLNNFFPTFSLQYSNAYNLLGGTWAWQLFPYGPTINLDFIHQTLAYIISMFFYIVDFFSFVADSIYFLLSLFLISFYILIYPLNYLVGALTIGVLSISFMTSIQIVSSKIGG